MSANDLNTRFTEATESGDPERIAAALHELREVFPRAPIQAPHPDVLDAFAGGAPGSVVMDYVWVLGNYRPFAPPVDATEILRWWAEAVVRHPDGASALQITLYLRHDSLPAGADVGDVIAYLAERGVRSGKEEQGAEYLARYFLDHSQTYARAVATLTLWVGKPVLGDVLRQVTPYVRPEDRAGLGL
ncbi:hypothetical protein PV646_02640 [Streptomyces sp. ID05-26A]|nr:hypothetical protein [Streptomyces sp. ID05-26A]